jgi:hypothetical protein
VSRIMSVDESSATGIRRLMLWQTRRQYGYIPGIIKLLLPIIRVGLPVSRLYDYLHLRKNSPLTRLQREMLATVVNGAVGGAP